MFEARSKIDPDKYAAIKKLVDQRLLDSYQHVEKRKALKERLEAALDAKFVERGSKNQPIYLEFLKASEEANQLLF